MERERRGEAASKKDTQSKTPPAGSEPVHGTASIEHGLWTPKDDLMLMTAVPHVLDLRIVHAGTRFSRKFSLQDVENRWQQLLYNRNVSEEAKKRIREMPIEDILRIQAFCVLSKKEEDLLRSLDLGETCPSPTVEMIEELLKKHPDDFHTARTPQILLDQWHLLNTYKDVAPGRCAGMTNWRSVQRDSRRENRIGRVNFDENRILNAAATCRRLSNLYGAVFGAAAPLPPDIRATIVGRVVRYVIRTDRVLLGRSSHLGPVDLDLSLEGPALKVSRKQAVISLDEATGRFVLTNMGSRPVFVDGKQVGQDQSAELRDQTVIRIAAIRLVFFANN